MQRNRGFRVADQIADIERAAAVIRQIKRIRADLRQNGISIVRHNGRQRYAAIKGVRTNDRRGIGDFCRCKRNAAIKPIGKVIDGEQAGIFKKDRRDLFPHRRPRLICHTGKGGAAAAAGNEQHSVIRQLPLDIAAWNRAGGGCV